MNWRNTMTHLLAWSPEIVLDGSQCRSSWIFWTRDLFYWNEFLSPSLHIAQPPMSLLLHVTMKYSWCTNGSLVLKFNSLTVQHLKYSQVLLCAFKHISCHLIFIMVLSWVSTQTIFKFRDLKVGQNLRSCNKKSQYHLHMKGKSSRYTAF